MGSDEVEKLRSDVKSAALEVKDDVERMIISKGKGKGGKIAEALVHVGEKLEHVGTTKGGRVGEVVGVIGSVIEHIGAEVQDKLKKEQTKALSMGVSSEASSSQSVPYTSCV